jgi:hypothetical protein
MLNLKLIQRNLMTQLDKNNMTFRNKFAFRLRLYKGMQELMKQILISTTINMNTDVIEK